MKNPCKRLTALLPLAALFCALALAQDGAAPAVDETAEALLRRVAETYKGLRQFYFTATEQTRTHSENLDRRTESEYVVAADSSGRARMQLTGQTNDSLSIFDGETSWFYVPKTRQYIKRGRNPFAPANSARSNGQPFDIHKSASRYVQRYSGVADRLESARITEVKSADEPRGKVNYVVVEAEYKTPPGTSQGSVRRTFWIDQPRGIVGREVSAASMIPPNIGKRVEVTQTISFQKLIVNGRPPAGTFDFTPPKNAELVEAFGPTQEAISRRVGTPAKNFTRNDLSGETFRLEELRGKVVLLNFWATWCRPCRIDLPYIEALHREFSGKGLVVLGVNSEPGALAARFFAEHGYSFPSLVDAGDQVAIDYSVQSLPTTIVIGRNGDISGYLVGVHREKRLRLELAKAGLE
jgi:peroxiredoxin/outer membrane lipoprotein-sorting protein